MSIGASSGSVALSDLSLNKHPLSHGQQAIWFLHRLAPESPAYNIPVAVLVRAELDVPAFRRAFQELVNRHACLRTTFESPSGMPIQLVHEQAEVCFTKVDASGWNEHQLNKRMLLEAHVPFNLEQGPLLRVSLFTRSKQISFLMLVVHHIVADFWSLGLMMQELGILYEAEKFSIPAPITPLDWQYSDYVRSEAEMLASPEGERLWTYWQEQLSGELPTLNLPTDRPRPLLQTYVGASENFNIDLTTTRALKALGRKYKATLYMTLMSAFQVLLRRYTGQNDILVGAPAAGRKNPSLAGMVGYLVNPVVVRGDLFDGQTFTELLARSRDKMLSAFDHQAFPFPLLVERLQPVRDASCSPLFQVMFVWQKTPRLKKSGLAAFALGEEGARVEMGELYMESIALDHRIAQFDLTLMVAELDGGLTASLQYNVDLFDAATIRRMARHFQTLLGGIVANPDRQIGDLPLLVESELNQFFEWNHAHTINAPNACIHHLFEAQVERTPEALAVVHDHQQLTYFELNRRANQLANHLISLGVCPESRVAVCLSRSSDMIVALLAILKAGGAYVALDPKYPAQRLSLMMEDARASVLLTEANLSELTPRHNARLLCIDTDWEAISAQRDTNPITSVGPGNLAYVIYTSGSTGTPKGAAIEHRSTAVFIRWAHEVFNAEQLEGVLASTSLCFDLSVFEIFVPLTCGGKVILADNALQGPSLKAAGLVSLINTVPSAMAELVRMGSLPSSVRVVNLAGEPFTAKLVEQIYEQIGVKEVYNLYGPSEDTTYSTFELVRRGADPTIGRPVANTQVYVLDERKQCVPIGVVGELHLAGDGLARGYLNRPDATAEKWIPNPYSREVGGRLYGTGDLARYLADGRIEYLGRLDHQVKVRGYRIELGEIEAALEEHEAVEESVVVAHGEPGSGRRLIGYVVSTRGVTAEDLRRHLKQRLPEYMQPSAYVMLDRIPMTPNGKVDRRALPLPDQTRPDLEARYVAPGTATEQKLAEIFEQVLGIERVGVNDNFFEVGGHSLLATQVVSRVRDWCGVELALRSMFERPTLASLAELIEHSTADTADPDTPDIEVLPRGDKVLDQLLADLDHLSSDQVQALIAEELRQTDQKKGD